MEKFDLCRPKKEQKADMIWGTGFGIEESFRRSIADPANLFDSLLDPENTCGRSDRLFDGKNRLGTAIDRAFMELVGPDYKFIDESMAEFIRRIMQKKGFDFLVYEPEKPPAKRSRSDSEPEDLLLTRSMSCSLH